MVVEAVIAAICWVLVLGGSEVGSADMDGIFEAGGVEQLKNKWRYPVAWSLEMW